MKRLNYYIKSFLLAYLLVLFSLTVAAQQIEPIVEDTASTVNPYLLKLEQEVYIGFKTQERGKLVGALSSVKPSEFLKYDNTQWVRDALNGRMIGLKWSDNIRGLGSALIVVDGIPGRSIDLLNMEEIDEITILKDANAAALYGSMAHNGVIVVTTKRGSDKKQFNVSASSGLKFPTRLPDYLNSADYMEMYNEAKVNDGLSQAYSQQEIENYRSGSNSYLYPDIDFYGSDYLKSFSSFTNITADFSGGVKDTKYYINLGFKSDSDLQDVSAENDKGTIRFNVRGNIDFKVNDWIKSSLDVVTIIERNRSSLTNLYDAGHDFRPNLYSPLLPVSMVDTTGNEELAGILEAANKYDGSILGGRGVYNDNVPLADVIAGGYQTDMTRVSQVNNAINFDLNTIAKGLTAKTYVSFDFYNRYNLSVTNSYAVYEPTWNDEQQIIGLKNIKDADLKDQVENVRTDIFTIRYGFYGMLNYEKQFSDHHNFNASFIGFANNTFMKDSTQSSKNSHLALSLNYSYKDKIFADFSSSYINSVKLAEGHRGKFAPTAGLAYVLSQEDFLSNSNWIDYLKVKVSGGIIYSDLSMPGYYLYDAVYEQSGSGYRWGDTYRGGRSNASTKILRGQNSNLGPEKRTDLNVGFETVLMKKFWVEANAFQSIMGEQVIRASMMFPSYYNSFRPYTNYNEDKYSGFELGVNYADKIGELGINWGARVLYTSSEKTKVDEVHEEEYQYRKGTQTDAIWGLEAIGFFSPDDFSADGTLLSGIPTQYGQVQAGDLKYRNMNGDDVINDDDIVQIGQWNAPWNFGSDVTLKYGSFSFFALFTAELGADGIKTGAYYRPQGNDKYSEVVLGRWTEETANTATFPRLSSIENTNNYGKESSFWLYDNTNFKIHRVQLTFDMPKQLIAKLKLDELSLYLSGSNLVEFSTNKDIRELSLDYAPNYRNYSVGFRMKF
ncbi:MAG: SusC/RagA family TonB-linked outer membrane protein [Prolixibacteraceae bacterium]